MYKKPKFDYDKKSENVGNMENKNIARRFMICKNCEYCEMTEFETTNLTSTVYFCHLFPPQPKFFKSRFPDVKEDDWCAQFKYKNKG